MPILQIPIHQKHNNEKKLLKLPLEYGNISVIGCYNAYDLLQFLECVIALIHFILCYLCWLWNIYIGGLDNNQYQVC